MSQPATSATSATSAAVPAATATVSAATPSTPPAGGGTYDSVLDLLAAYEAAGGACDDFRYRHPAPVAKVIHCDDTEISIYPSSSDISQRIQDVQDAKDRAGVTDDQEIWLVGENWVVIDPYAATLKTRMGGRLVSFS